VNSRTLSTSIKIFIGVISSYWAVVLSTGRPCVPEVKGELPLLVGYNHILVCLLSIFPKPFILKLPFRIIEFSITVPIVVIEIPLILPSVIPTVHSIPSFFIVAVMSAVPLQTVPAGKPYSVATSLALLKVAFVRTIIGPQVFAKALRHPINEFPFIIVSVFVMFYSFSML
jgi:hypothetical protein